MTTVGGRQLASRPRSSRHRIPGAAWILLAVAALIAGVAGLLIHQGLKEVPRAAPLPVAGFSVQPQPAGVGAGARVIGSGLSTTMATADTDQTAGTAGDAPGGQMTADAATGSGGAAAPQTFAGAGGSGARPQQPSTPLAEDHLVIPALGVNAPLIPEAVSDGALTIPGDVGTVGVWTGSGAISGATGTILLAGHIDNINQGPGALHDLYLLQPGDRVFVQLHGVATVWQIVTLGSYPKSEIPQDLFDGLQGPRRLALVTCGGQIHNGEYDQNVVATAVPA